MRPGAHALSMNAPGFFARSMLVAIACMSGACNRSTPAVVVTQATFGLYRTEQAGQAIFEPTRVVPLAAGQQYGWLIRIRTDRPRIRWHEELTLPSSPQTWGKEQIGTRVLAANKRSIVTEREVRADSGYIFNAWKVEPGDPPGRYAITVSIEDGPSRTFAFELK
jgi:hypothetical protein